WDGIFNWLFSNQSSPLSQKQQRQLALVFKLLMEHILNKAQNIKALKDDLLGWQSVRWVSLSLDPARSFQKLRELALGPADYLSELLNFSNNFTSLRSIQFDWFSRRRTDISNANTNNFVDL